MPFLGNTPAQGFAESITKDSFTPNGSTTAFTLSKTAATNSISVFVGNVRQEPTSSYSVSGTTLNMTEAPSTGTSFYVLHSQGTIESTTVLPAGSVVTNSLASSIDLSGKTVTYGLVNTDMATGSVIQVVCAKYSTQVTSTSATPSDTGLTATITPSSTSSTILVSVHQNAPFISSDNNANDIGIWLYKGSTQISRLAFELGFTGSSHYSTTATVSTSYLDSPSTTNATTYKTKFANPDGGGAGGYVRVQNATNESTITLMEIKG